MLGSNYKPYFNWFIFYYNKKLNNIYQWLGIVNKEYILTKLILEFYTFIMSRKGGKGNKEYKLRK